MLLVEMAARRHDEGFNRIVTKAELSRLFACLRLDVRAHAQADLENCQRLQAVVAGGVVTRGGEVLHERIVGAMGVTVGVAELQSGSSVARVLRDDALQGCDAVEHKRSVAHGD